MICPDSDGHCDEYSSIVLEAELSLEQRLYRVVVTPEGGECSVQRGRVDLARCVRIGAMFQQYLDTFCVLPRPLMLGYGQCGVQKVTMLSSLRTHAYS
jgi:hypothetical protein